jgi:F-type H+-transporting ATPase subunit b
MLRQPTLALGLLALTLSLGLPAQPLHAQEHAPSAAKPASAETKGEATHAEPAQPDILEVQSPLAIWTLVVFVCLLGILGRFAWGPLMKALHEREAHLEHVLLDSEKARNEAEAIAAEHRRQLDAAADQVRAILDEARREAVASGDAILRKAQGEAEAARVRAEKEIESARDQALMEIWSKTADLAVSVAGRVLEKDLGEGDHRRLVELAIHELPANSGSRA